VTPYSIIRAGDRINVNAQTVATVVAVRKYTQLTSVLQTEDLSLLLPLSAASSVSTIAAGQRHFRQFISVAEEEQNGLVVFQLVVAAPSAQGTAQAAGGDWSSAFFSAIAAYSFVVTDMVALLRAHLRPPVCQARHRVLHGRPALRLPGFASAADLGRAGQRKSCNNGEWARDRMANDASAWDGARSCKWTASSILRRINIGCCEPSHEFHGRNDRQSRPVSLFPRVSNALCYIGARFLSHSWSAARSRLMRFSGFARSRPAIKLRALAETPQSLENAYSTCSMRLYISI